MTHAAALSPSHASHERLGLLLVLGSALVWSFGGAIARSITVDDPWTVVFWRSAFAAAFLICFMLWRDGFTGTFRLFRAMGLPGLAVALCFATGSISFIVALGYTTVANILLMQAGVPLIAALLAWAAFGERASPVTWAAIAAVIFGIAVMVSGSFSGKISPIGDGLALLITCAVSIAVVITRRASHVRMIPATCLSTLIAVAISSVLAGGFLVSAPDFGWLFAFGALNLGLGLAMFATGARLIPAALAALAGTLEPVLAPIWVWLSHGEIPGPRTVIGGAIVFLALLAHILIDLQRQRAPLRTTASPSPSGHSPPRRPGG